MTFWTTVFAVITGVVISNLIGFAIAASVVGIKALHERARSKAFLRKIGA